METEALLATLAAEGGRFADAVAAGPLTARVPDCPAWDVGDLARHLGEVHLWAAGHVADPHDEPDEPFDRRSVAHLWPDLVEPPDGGPDELAGWYRACNGALVATLRATDDDVPAWTFLPAPTARHHWVRRQAHETAVHRYDADRARGRTGDGGFATDFAVDGVEEFLDGFLRRPRPGAATTPRTVRLDATDHDASWWLTLRPERVDVAREGPATPDVVVTAPAADLYLLLWNRDRGDRVAVDGDRTALDGYGAAVTIRWS